MRFIPHWYGHENEWSDTKSGTNCTLFKHSERFWGVRGLGCRGIVVVVEWETTTIMLERLREPQDDAWKVFMDRFRRPLLSFAMRSGLSQAQAEDATQEAMLSFIEGYRSGRYDRSRGRLGSWLFTLAYQSIRSQRRDAARDAKQSPSLVGRTTFFSALPDEENARSDWEQDWDRHLLAECLTQLRAELNATHMRAFELAALKEVPAETVAEELGISRDSVYQIRFRALKRLSELREELDAVEVNAS